MKRAQFRLNFQMNMIFLIKLTKFETNKQMIVVPLIGNAEFRNLFEMTNISLKKSA